MSGDVLESLRPALSDRYTVEREIGRGGMATVYLATDLKLHRTVAIKVLRPELTASLFAERFLREIEITANLQHPHILPIHDSGKADGLLYYVMPYVEGESLRDRLSREKQLSIDDAVRIACEVADGLAYLHREGVVHRDIKPENVLLDQGHAVVADFGIARALTAAGGERLTETGLAVGTPAYLSPEQASGEADIDGRTDIYSLGCVLFEMLGGDPPYSASTPQGVIAKKLGEPVPSVRLLRETVSDGLEQVVTKALAKARADRYETADELAKALIAAESDPSHNARLQRKRRSAIAILATLVVAIGIALASWLLRDRGAGAMRELDPSRLIVVARESATDHGWWVADDLVRGIERARLMNVTPSALAMDHWRAVNEGGAASPVRAVAELAGAAKVLVITARPISDSLSLHAELIDVRNDSLLHSAPQSGTEREALTRLSEDLMGALAVHVDPRFNEVTGALVQPPNFSAFGDFKQGVELFMSGQYPESLEPLAAAHERDTTFSQALLWLATANRNLRHANAVDSLVALLSRPDLQLSAHDRLWRERLRATNLQQRLRASRELAAIDPTFWSFDHGQDAALLLHLDEALAATERVNPDSGFYQDWTPWWWNSWLVHQLMGDFDRALESARRGKEMMPAGHPLIDLFWMAEAEALAALGHVDELDALLLGPLPENRFGRGWFMMVSAMALRTYGHVTLFREVANRSVQWYEQEFGGTEPSSRDKILWAWALYVADDWEGAHRMLESIKADAPEDLELQVLGTLGAAKARLGNSAGAAEIMQELQQRDNVGSNGVPAYQGARIAAVLGRLDRATELFEAAIEQGILELWAITVIAETDFEGLRGYGPFEELMKGRQ